MKTFEAPEDKQLCTIKQVKWNGEGLPPIGCKIKTKRGISEVLSTSDWDGGVVTYSYKHEDGGMSIECAWNNKSWINPIETPKAKKEREELEAAHALYIDSKQSMEPCMSKQVFINTEGGEQDFWLRIVRKTGYRKGE